MTENELSKVILDTSFELHTALGPGLLESVYEQALAYDLRERGLHIETQIPVPLVYK